MSAFLPVKKQIDALKLIQRRPLLITDADEVLLQFVAGLESFLTKKGLWLDLTSYHLAGNIKRQTSNEDYPHEEIAELITEFLVQGVSSLQPVPGAAETLHHLSRRLQIVILTNLPTKLQPVREKHLARHGMPYPVIVNEGNKGRAAKYFFDRVQAPVFFLDDAPQHLMSVKEWLETCFCIHFVSDDRLARLTEVPSTVDHKAKSWLDIERVITKQLDKISSEP